MRKQLTIIPLRWRLGSVGVLFLLLPSFCIASNNVVNVYNWSLYMPMHVVKEFETATGVHVNYSVFDSNAVLYAKLKSDPDAGYDIVVPSSYYVQRMIREDMLRKLDQSQLPNMKYMNPLLMNKPFDPHNNYSLPYLWGTTGMVVNDKYYNPKDFQHWSDWWKPKYKNQLLIMNDMREAFNIAFITLNYSINDKNPKHIKQAYLVLRQLMPNIKLFNSDAEINIYADEDAVLGMGWNGDVFLATQVNPHIKFIYPKDRFPLWIDNVVIPKNAPHYQNALKFINFIMQPKIAAEIAVYNGYTSPNLAAVKLLPAYLRDNKSLNPSADTLKRAEVNTDLGATDAIYEKYWQLLKLGS